MNKHWLSSEYNLKELNYLSCNGLGSIKPTAMSELQYNIINVVNHIMLIGLSITFIVAIYKVARMKKRH